MDVRGHNMERKSFSRIKMKEFTVHMHLRANLVLAQYWPNIFQTYINKGINSARRHGQTQG